MIYAGVKNKLRNMILIEKDLIFHTKTRISSQEENQTKKLRN